MDFFQDLYKLDHELSLLMKIIYNSNKLFFLNLQILLNIQLAILLLV